MPSLLACCVLLGLYVSSVSGDFYDDYYDADYLYEYGKPIKGKTAPTKHSASSPRNNIYANKVRWRVTSIANRVFAFKLYSRVAADHKGENILISPLIVSTGLSMTLLGAEGVTEKELMSVLEYSSIGQKRHGYAYLVLGTLSGHVTNAYRIGAVVSEKQWVVSGTNSIILMLRNRKPYTKADVPRLYESLLEKLNNSETHPGDTFLIACRLFGEQSEPFLTKFIKDTARYYGAEMQQLDFAGHSEDARTAINSWANVTTRGHIPEALPDGTVDASSLLVLASAAYFKGTWKYQFDSDDTQPGTFALYDGTTLTTDFMRGKFNILNKYSHSLRSFIIVLPYKSHGSAFSTEMRLFLPDDSEALDRVENMSEMELRRECRNMINSSLEIYLPKFQLDFGVDLARTLSDLGLESLFGNADLSGMNGKQNLHFTNAIHKGFIEVNEDGTTATAVFLATSTRSAGPVTLVFDRPFFFLIREKSSNSMLFMGRVNNPR